jgi:alkylation response protein AidB-like acyl-CoA dehydrogenase
MDDRSQRIIPLLAAQKLMIPLYQRPGGSDVSQTETTAVPTSRLPQDLGKPYLLNGLKWFSSAAEGNIAVALARTGRPSSGSRGLSLFLVPVRLPNSPWNTPLANGVRIHRLKDKFGTHGVPTAELSLNNTRAWLLGPLNGGVKAISAMLNLSRIHSAVHSTGSLARCLAIARSYATVRRVNGGQTLLQDIPLHIANLAAVNVLYRALVYLTFGAVRLLGQSECGIATAEEEGRLRLLTPTVKAFAALRATGAMEECMASLGGMGYMEEVGIGRYV